MSSILWKVRQELKRLTNTLFVHSAERSISVRLSVIAQGDYGGIITQLEDPTPIQHAYTLLATPFSSSPAVPIRFIQTVSPSGPQASEEGETYEQVLCMARTLAWRPTAKKILVVIGDDIPHPPMCRENTSHVDWKHEMSELVAMGVDIYAIQCSSNGRHPRYADFYRELGASGAHIEMAQFNTVVEILLATFYRATSEQARLEAHEQEIIAAGRYSRNLEKTFNTLLQRPDAGAAVYGSATHTGRTPVAPGRFQRLHVTTEMSIKSFVEATGARYKAGDGYYQLTKSEDISLQKNVVLEHIASGEMFSGLEARTLLGLSVSITKVTMRSIPDGYRAFVQSTSQTRKLVKDSSFLWEVDASA